MTRFEALKSQFVELKRKEDAYWDDLFSAASILAHEFATYIQVPLKDPQDESTKRSPLVFGKVVNYDFFECELSDIERGLDQIDFALSLFLDAEPCAKPPSRLNVKLSLCKVGDDYVVSIDHRLNKVRVIDGDFGDVNAAIYEHFKGAFVPKFDIV
ncbi:hypothetical protein PS903_02011 [Pseudomonas fluorescens]|nr:hypothetical protein PS903_02011 [Pseudomonas fluorescens]